MSTIVLCLLLAFCSNLLLAIALWKMDRESKRESATQFSPFKRPLPFRAADLA